MEKISYESPKMTFVNLRSNKAIANECWKYAKIEGDDPLFYDTPGTGYVKFSVSGANNCGAGNPSLIFNITDYIKPDGSDWTDTEKDAAKSAFDKWVTETAIPNGSSFMGDRYSEGDPGSAS